MDRNTQFGVPMHLLSRLRPRLRRSGRTRGQSLVEFALILPVFILFFGAVLDLGRIAAARLTIANASREGAFQAAQTPASYSANQACPLGATTNLVVCRVLLEAKNSVITIQPSDISLVCTPDCSRALGHRVSVTVQGSLTLLMPFMAPLLGGQTVSFASTATTQLEALPTGVTAATPTPSPSASSTASPSPTPTPAPTPAPTCGPPSAGFTYTTTPPSMRAPVRLNVTDTSTSPGCAISSWLWNWGDGSTSSAQNPPQKTYVAPGTYTVTLQVSNASGSSTTGALVLKVK